MKKVLYVALSASLIGLSGRSWAAPADPLAKGGLVSDFDGPIDDWKPYNADKSTLKVSSVSGKSGKALEAAFKLPEANQWVAISKEAPLPDPTGKEIRFSLKSTIKNNATLEVKMVDEDGSIYGHKIPLTTTGFTEQKIPFSNFTYWWGGNSKLDKVQKFEFAVSSEGPAEGTFAIDDLKLVTP